LASLGPEVAAFLDVFDVTGALERIWKEVRALNALVEERKPWELAKDDSRAADLDRTLYELTDGLRAVAVALFAYLPETAPQILAALRQPNDLAWEGVAPDRTVAAEGIGPAEPLFPRVEAPSAAA
jgi:methionyl-tRNA synthetase